MFKSKKEETQVENPLQAELEQLKSTLKAHKLMLA